MSNCFDCPRKCGADREKTEGVCGAKNEIIISRVAPHYWEEPCISGEKGSGTVFFSGCNLGCVYCQNYKINKGNVGSKYTVAELASLFERLDKSDVHNINLVTPTHYTSRIAEALSIYTPKKPIVYNSSGYDLPRQFENLKVSVFLPDFKYADSLLAKNLSFAEDYPQVALNAIDKMVSLCPDPTFENGIMTKGVIVRHLVLPTKTDNSMKALRLLHNRYGDSIYISIMKQYTPVGNMPYDFLNRSVTDDEYELVLDYANHIGITNGFTQTGESIGESFIPNFDGKEYI